MYRPGPGPTSTHGSGATHGAGPTPGPGPTPGGHRHILCTSLLVGLAQSSHISLPQFTQHPYFSLADPQHLHMFLSYG